MKKVKQFVFGSGVVMLYALVIYQAARMLTPSDAPPVSSAPRVSWSEEAYEFLHTTEGRTTTDHRTGEDLCTLIHFVDDHETYMYVDCDGEIHWPLGKYRGLRLLKDFLLYLQERKLT